MHLDHPVSNHFKSLGFPISNELETELSVCFQPQSLEKGEYFHEVGKVCEKIAFVSSGMVRHFYEIDGEEYTRWVSLSNTFATSLHSFIHQTPSIDSLQCIAECSLYTSDHTDFDRIKNKFPVMQSIWSSALEQEISKYHNRVLLFISNNAEQRYLNFMNSHPRVVLEVPQKYLSSMLGIDPRHLSRVRKSISKSKK